MPKSLARSAISTLKTIAPSAVTAAIVSSPVSSSTAEALMSAIDTVYVPSLVTSAVPAVHSVTVPFEPSVWPVASIIEGYQSASAYITDASYCADAATAIVPATDAATMPAIIFLNFILMSSINFVLRLHKYKICYLHYK